jgi:hypothetical protein
MEDLFLSYPTSFELKELGFNEPCFGKFTRSVYIPGISEDKTYKLELEIDLNSTFDDNKNENFPTDWCSAPTYQQAFRWFRMEHNLICKVDVTSYGCPLNEQEFFCEITSNRGTASYEIFDTYEEAELECLKKLIEIVKHNG